MEKLRIAVVGASGNVGELMLELIPTFLGEGHDIIGVGSESSVGRVLESKSGRITMESIDSALEKKPHLTLFSAGAKASKEHAEKFVKVGSFVVDNSSAWRMEQDIPLVVPEVNAGLLSSNKKLIANPNCSTIQLTLVLNALEKNFGLERVVVSTYQSVSGAGRDAVKQMENERNGAEGVDPKPLFQTIDQNLVPHIDKFLDNGYTKEEWKIIEESRKILGLPNLRITVTSVRVPVRTGHSESVNIELSKAFQLDDLTKVLSSFSGITVEDSPKDKLYPMPLPAEGKDDVFVGRIRRDDSIENGVNLWVVSDNLRKGAATNALQIASLLKQNQWLGVG